MLESDERRGRGERARRAWRSAGVLALVIGLALQVWLWQRGALELVETAGGVELCGMQKYGDSGLGSDQIYLLTPAVERYLGGDLLPYSKRMSGGVIVPGSLLQILLSAPLEIAFDYRASSALLLVFHALAGLLIFLAARESAGERFAILYFALFWLSPWRLYHSGFLWEPAFIVLPAAMHFWAHLRSFESASRWASLVLAVTLAVAPQLHASAILILAISGLLLLRGRLHLHWPYFGLGLILGALPLIPTLVAYLGDQLDVVDEHHPTESAWEPLRLLYRLPRALGYWIRVASLDLGRRFRQTDFLNAEVANVGTVLAFALALLALVSALVVAGANWQWLRGRLARMRPGDFPASYASAAFWTLLAAAAVSPITLQGWHAVILLPAALLPVAAWIDERWALGAQPSRRRAIAVATVAVLCTLLLGFGHPMYARLPADAGTQCTKIASPDAAPALVLHNVTTVRGPDAEEKPGRTILIRGQRIAMVGPVGYLQTPANAEKLTLPGRWVVPAEGAKLEAGARADLWVLRASPSFDEGDRQKIEMRVEGGELRGGSAAPP